MGPPRKTQTSQLRFLDPPQLEEAETAIGTIWIRCPATAREVSTGIETDPESFAQIPDPIGNSLCPVCGIRHEWLKRHAWLADDGCGQEVVREAS
jgi:hypothetical protein